MVRANAATNSGGPDLINFAIPGAGPHTISPGTELPEIEDPVTIDGYTEALDEAMPATPNTLAFGTNAVLKIVISGASATPPDSSNGVDGFDVEAGPTTIRGLAIIGFQESTNAYPGRRLAGYRHPLEAFIRAPDVDEEVSGFVVEDHGSVS